MRKRPKKKNPSHRMHHRVHHYHRRNASSAQSHARRYGRYRRRHNPTLGLNVKTILEYSGWAIVGGTLTRIVPASVQFLATRNTGVIGYGENALTGLVAAWLAGKFAGEVAATGVAIGSVVMIAGRIVSDMFGKTLVSFGSGVSGVRRLSGDHAFDVRSLRAYAKSYTALPGNIVNWPVEQAPWESEVQAIEKQVAAEKKAPSARFTM